MQVQDVAEKIDYRRLSQYTVTTGRDRADQAGVNGILVEISGKIEMYFQSITIGDTKVVEAPRPRLGEFLKISLLHMRRPLP